VSPQDVLKEANVLEQKPVGGSPTDSCEKVKSDDAENGGKLCVAATASKTSTSSIASEGPAPRVQSVHADTATAVAAAPYDHTRENRTCNSKSSSCTRKIFKEKYNLHRVLSKALYGNIFTCVDKATSEAFACKVMSNSRVKWRPNISDDPSTEFKLLGLLSDRPHPNLLGLVDQFEDTKNTYFVLPLARGGDLLSSVQCHSDGLGDKLTREIFQQLVLGLQHLHTMGWQHGDVSLENILVMSPGDFSSLKICDFGLSSRMGSPGRSAGKLAYMPPEVLAGAVNKTTQKKAASTFVASAAQDVFSLGVAMFTTLFGFPPFNYAQHKDGLYRDISRNKSAYRAKLRQWGVAPDKTRLPILSLLMNMMSEDAAKRPSLTTILKYLKDLES